MTVNQVFELNIASFFDYVKTIRYGYRDRSGVLHFPDDPGFEVRDYAFSSPEDLVQNNCGWCWDVANLIAAYCRQHQLEHITVFMEYYTEVFHQTHTQVFIRYQDKWYAAPDNTSPDSFGTNGFSTFEECQEHFVAGFIRFLKYTLKDQYDESHLFLNRVHAEFQSGISDETYLTLARQ